GSNKTEKVFKVFSNPENVYKADYNTLKKSNIFSAGELERISTIRLEYAESVLKKCKEFGYSMIGYGDKGYPECIKNIPNPPIVLYYRGVFPDFDNNPVICIVGPRRISDFGKRAAYALGMRLSRAGFIVVSGGAVGGDYYAHSGALKYGGKTVLFMGCGLNVNYPPQSHRLRESVAKSGCVISEYPPFTPAFGKNFPIRNRLMSGMALGTIVVEGPTRSGAIITAKHACEQGRDVFVIPGSKEDPHYTASNELLREGAKPLINTLDIFNEYILNFPDKINIERAFEKKENKESKKKKKISDIALSKEAKILYNHLDSKEFYPESFSDLGLSGGDILSALTELEICGVIKSQPGGKYILNR
ncbi:MAG: DNA-processing protein DprA, partial [Clostridia bacterium]|nr:DNA-processing protein DprA [Clostridia bacterium]